MIPGLRRSSGEGKWVPTQVFLNGEFHGHRGACWTTIHGVTKSRTLSLSRPFITFCIGSLCISYRERLYKHNYATVITPYKITNCCSPSTCFSTVQLCRSVVFDSLQPHESQHTRPPCPSPTLGVHSDSCPSSW